MDKFFTPTKYLILFSFILTFLSSGAQWVFKENKGQWPDKVSFAADIPGGQVYLENSTFTFDVFIFDEEDHSEHHVHGPHGPLPKGKFAYKVNFVGASTASIGSSSPADRTRFNYFLGSDRSKWAGNVRGFPTIQYTELYPNIDLDLRGTDNELKYDLICRPGFNPDDIELSVEGFQSVKITSDKIFYQDETLSLVESIPATYQIIDGDTIQVDCAYYRKENGNAGLRLGEYNTEYQVIIDPSLILSTYSGSFSDNFGFTATYDNEGFLYGGGNAFGAQYPTTSGAYDETYNGTSTNRFDVVISKFDTTGNFMVYSTYLGGLENEQPHSIVANEFGELFILGTTGSNNFPTTPGAFDRTFDGGAITTANFQFVDFPNGIDMFVSRLSAEGDALLASTYLGGSENDGFNGKFIDDEGANVDPEPNTLYNYADEFRGEIDLDAAGNVYIASSTFSPDFPITGDAIQSNLVPSGSTSLSDGIITIFRRSLEGPLLFSSYFGGSGSDVIHAIAVKENEILFTGGTSSPDLANGIPQDKLGFQPFFGGNTDGIIGSIDLTTKELNFFSYLGDSFYDQSFFIEFDKEDFIYVFGQTEETGLFFTTGNPGYNDLSGGLFVTKISADGQQKLLSTTIGEGVGLPRISPTAFLVDNCQRIYISGWGTNLSGQYPNLNSSFLPATNDAYDGISEAPGEMYLAVFGPDMSTHVYGTYFGDPNQGEHVDGGTSRFDKKGFVYQIVCASCGGNQTFPTTPGAHSSRNRSNNCNLAVFKFDFDPPLVTADFSIPDPGCQPDNVYTFSNLSSPAEEYKWDFGDGNTSTDFSPTHTYTSPGIYTVSLVANKPDACNLSDTTRKTFSFFFGGESSINDTILCEPGSISIGPDLDPNIPVVSLEWENHPDIDDRTNPNPTVTPTDDATYRLVVDIGGGCEIIYSYQVQFEAIDVQLPVDSITCDEQNPFTITIPAQSVANTYSWSDDRAFSNILASGTTFNANFDEEDRFYLRVESDNCTHIDSIDLRRYNAELPDDTVICDGAENITLSVNLNSDVTEIQWSDADDFSTTLNSNNLDNDIVVSGTDSAYYYYRVNTRDCEKIDSVLVAPIVVEQPEDSVICAGESIELGFLVPTNPNLTYSWFPHPDIPNTAAPNPTVSPTANTSYILLVEVNEDCSYALEFNVSINEILYDITPDTLICNNEEAFQVRVFNTSPVDVTWSSNSGFTDKLNSGNNGSFSVSPAHGIYTYYVLLESGNCEIIDSVTIYRHEPIVPVTLNLCDTASTLELSSDGFGLIETFLWSDERDLSNVLNDNERDSVIEVSPNDAQYYYLQTTTEFCTYFDSILVAPFIVEISSDTLVCDPNDPIELSATGNYDINRYFWSENPGFTSTLNGPADGDITVLPDAETSTYYIRVEAAECAVEDSVRLLRHFPTETPNVTYCDTRDSLDLISDGLGEISTFEWSESLTFSPLLNDNFSDSTIRVSPTSDIVYYIRTRTPFCEYIDSVQVAPFIVQVSPDTLVCDPNTLVTFDAFGSFENDNSPITITWSDDLTFANVLNPGGGNSITVTSGSETDTYVVRLEGNGCSIIDSSRVLIHDPFDADELIICSETADVELLSNGYGKINSFIWSSNRNFTDTLNDNTLDSVITVNPPISSWFYIKTESDLCEYEDSVFVRRLIPNLISDTLLCDPNTPIIITVDGKGVTNNFIWDTLPDFSSVPPLPTFNNDSTIQVLPDETTTFYIFMESLNCNYIDSVTVVRYDFGLDQDTLTFCEGDEVNLAVTQDTSIISYEWSQDRDFSNILFTTPSISLNPTGSIRYYVKSSSEYCEYIDSIDVVPFILAPITDTTICPGSSVSLGYNPAPFSQAVYSWTPNPDIADPSNPNPLVTPSLGENIYTLNVSIPGLTCPQTVDQQVTVTPLLDSISPSQVYCDPNDIVVLRGFSIDTVNTQFIWSTSPTFSPALNNPDVDSIEVQPAATTTFYLRVDNGFCQEDTMVTVSVIDPLPFRQFQICDPEQAISITPDGQGLYENIIWSSNNNFTDTLNVLPDSVISVLPESSQYYYFKGVGTYCEYIDSVLIVRFESGLVPDTLVCNETQITLTANGNGLGSTFKWSDDRNFDNVLTASPSITIDPLPANTTMYYVEITSPGVGGCVYTDSTLVRILDNGLPDDPVYICSQGGFYTVTANSDGQANQFIWSTSPTFNPVIGGDSTLIVQPTELTRYYLRIVTDGCVYEDFIDVAPFVVPQLPLQTICPGESVTLGPNNPGDFPNATYVWEPDADINVTDLGTANPTIIPAETNTYYLSFSQGVCQIDLSQTIIVEEIGSLISGPNPYAICDASEPIELLASTDGRGRNFEWSEDPTFNFIIGTDSILNYQLLANQQTLYFRCESESGCPFDDQVTLVELDDVPQITSVNEFCLGDTVQLTVNPSSLLVNPLDIVWSPIDIMTTFPASGPTVFAVPTEPVTVEAQYIFNNDCAISTSKEISPSQVYFYEPEIEFLSDPVLTQEFTVSNNTPNPFLSTEWIPQGLDDDPTTLTQTYFADGDLDYIILKSDDGMCTKNDTVRLDSRYRGLICGAPNIYIPNAFSPNGDGENDVLRVRGDYVNEMLLRVYDRWGQLLFESRDQEVGWDGTFNGKLLSPAVYVFYVRGTCSDEQPFYIQGNVTLLR